MKFKILNENKFINAINKKVNKIVDVHADMITSKANDEMALVTQKFKGHSNSIIAGVDTNLITDKGQRVAFRYEIIPKAEVFSIFEENILNPNAGKILTRDDDPAWFEFNDIISDKVRVRNSGETSLFTTKVAMGSEERFFFNIVYGLMKSGLKRGLTGYLSK